MVYDNWQDLVDLIETIATALGAPIEGRAAMILDVIKSVPKPKRGVKQLSQWDKVDGLSSQIVVHIRKVLECHEYEVKHHLDDIAEWVKTMYNRVKRR